MHRKQLPIGIQTFRKIREGDCYYVDKTAAILRLIEQGTHYFLSRPRRFGKSLLLDTLAELFEANEPLFKGLAAHPRWDWQRRFPVAWLSFADADIRFSFLTGVSKFSKVNLFSGLNNLNDVAIDPEYSAICGYTEQDLDTVFAPELPGLDRDAIRD